MGVKVPGITQLELQALRPNDHGRTIQMGDGLRGTVRAGTDGMVSVYVTLRYRFNGAVREVSIGTWKAKDGKSKGTTLKALRDEADRIRAMVKEGKDPAAAAKAERERKAAEQEAQRLQEEADQQQTILEQKQRLQKLAAMNARLTVRGLFEQWQLLELGRRADQGSEVQRSFTRDVLPLIGDMAAEDVKKAHIQEILDTIKGRATTSNTMVRTAKKTLADLRQMFGFALDRDYIEADPTARVKKARLGADVERDRVLSEAELIELFQRLPQAGMVETSQAALLLQLSTVTRIGELLGARWADVDLDSRTLRLPETKNRKAHEVWLSDFARDQLKRLKAITGASPWVFPASRKPGESVCKKTVTKQVKDRQRTGGGLSGRSKHVQALTLPGGPWTPHDLRRTGATIMQELGVLPDVIEKGLNHTEEKKVKRVYQRAQYLGPMRQAWEVLGKRLEMLEAKARGVADNVVSLRAA